MFKGNKITTVEECDTAAIIRGMSVSTASEKTPGVSESKQQLLEQMIDRCAADLEKDHKKSLSLCLSLLTYLQKTVNKQNQALHPHR